MAYIEERIGRNGKKTYRVQIRMKGQPLQTKSFTRKTDAKEWARSIESAMREGRPYRTREGDKHTFGEMIDLYIKTVLPRKGQSSRHSQEPRLQWWKEQLGPRRLNDVTTADIAQCRDRLSLIKKRRKDENGVVRDTDECISPTTVTHYMAALSHVFTIAVDEWEWLQISPMRRVKKPKLPRGRVRFLSEDERKALLDACQASTHPYLYTAVVLALSTGMRKSEILNLTWDRVDFNNGFINLGPKDTKNREFRAVPLVGHALDVLRAHAKVRRLDTQLVFPSTRQRRTGEVGPVQFENAWRTARDDAKLDDFRFHDLRHSAASYLAMNGASPSVIAEVLGHKTLQMVKRYAHLSDSHVSDVVARMNEGIFGTSKDGQQLGG